MVYHIKVGVAIVYKSGLPLGGVPY